MTDESRWTDLPVPAVNGLWPDLRGKRYRVTIGLDMMTERIELEVPRLPTTPGWYRFPSEFGAVFLRDDGAWLDANGSLVSHAKIPDGLIPLIEATS